MAVKTKFHIGDRVLVTGVQDGLTEAVGKEGTVMWTFPSPNDRNDMVVVQFEQRFSDRLHSGSIGDDTRRCWQIIDDKLTIAPFPISVDDIDALL